MILGSLLLLLVVDMQAVAEGVDGCSERVDPVGKEEDTSSTEGSMRYEGRNRGNWDMTPMRSAAAADNESR